VDTTKATNRLLAAYFVLFRTKYPTIQSVIVHIKTFVFFSSLQQAGKRKGAVARFHQGHRSSSLYTQERLFDCNYRNGTTIPRLHSFAFCLCGNILLIDFRYAVICQPKNFRAGFRA
jgi:hypothetical protein